MIPILNLPRFFPTYTMRGKSAASSKLELFLTDWSLSFNVFALEIDRYSLSYEMDVNFVCLRNAAHAFQKALKN